MEHGQRLRFHTAWAHTGAPDWSITRWKDGAHGKPARFSKQQRAIACKDGLPFMRRTGVHGETRRDGLRRDRRMLPNGGQGCDEAPRQCGCLHRGIGEVAFGQALVARAGSFTFPRLERCLLSVRRRVAAGMLHSTRRALGVGLPAPAVWAGDDEREQEAQQSREHNFTIAQMLLVFKPDSGSHATCVRSCE